MSGTSAVAYRGWAGFPMRCGSARVHLGFDAKLLRL
jgi:hypothetical protein